MICLQKDLKAAEAKIDQQRKEHCKRIETFSDNQITFENQIGQYKKTDEE